MSTTTSIHERPKTKLNIPLWIDQVLLAAAYGMAGAMKLTQPIPELSAMMGWPGVLPEAMVRFVGAAELAGAAGLILPMLTRVQPRLTVFAAVGLVVLQICAMVFHASRGEYQVLPINIVLLLLAAIVVWGRRGLLSRTAEI